MRRLDHEKLHVYQTALDFLALADALIATLPRGHAYLADQLYRAASSVCLNIAEGAGEFSPRIAPGRELLVQVVAMLTTLARRRTKSARAES